MSELSPKARQILHSGRGLNRPTAEDRERIQGVLQQRLGAGLLAAEPAKAPPLARPRWPFVTGAIVGAGLIAGTLLLASLPKPAASGVTPVVAPLVVQTSAAPPAASAAEPPSAAVSSTPAAVSAPPPAALSSRSTSDGLAQEVALLARATSSLHAGRPADALKVLDEYQHRFPKGLLTEERSAAKAQALCALGRTSEAQAELARLAPQSLAAARAKQACDARPSAGH